MRKRTTLLVALLAVLVLGWNASTAQILPENHYLVYDVVENYPFSAQMVISDQFSIFTTDFVMLDKFANPVEKNGEPYWDPMLHQTWWLIDEPQPEWQVLLENQFGPQLWNVNNARYLVLPALKDMPGEPPPWNHYKCYDAVGPPMDIPVDLADQWGFYSAIVVDPVLFCNPCQKEVDGLVYPIIEPIVHMACYQLQPPIPAGIPALATDQFGEWPITAEEAIWLCLPTLKLQAIGTEGKTWSDVKSLFRN